MMDRQSLLTKRPRPIFSSLPLAGHTFSTCSATALTFAARSTPKIICTSHGRKMANDSKKLTRAQKPLHATFFIGAYFRSLREIPRPRFWLHKPYISNAERRRKVRGVARRRKRNDTLRILLETIQRGVEIKSVSKGGLLVHDSTKFQPSMISRNFQ